MPGGLGAYSALQLSRKTQIFGADDRIHDARSRPASRTGTPRTRAQNHFRDYEGIDRVCSKGSKPTTSQNGREASSVGLSCELTRSASGSTQTKRSGGSRSSFRRKARRTGSHQLLAANGRSVVVRQFPQRPVPSTPAVSSRARLFGTAADLTVAVVVAFASAAAGSRLLWPVLLIACYYAVGVLITGTSPMVALLSDGLPASPKPKDPPAPAPVPTAATEPAPARQPGRHAARLAGERPVGNAAECKLPSKTASNPGPSSPHMGWLWLRRVGSSVVVHLHRRLTGGCKTWGFCLWIVSGLVIGVIAKPLIRP